MLSFSAFKRVANPTTFRAIRSCSARIPVRAFSNTAFTQMKGILYYGNRDVRYTETAPEPQLVNGDDVKVKIGYCGICGTDLHEYLDGPIFFPRKKVSIKYPVSSFLKLKVMKCLERLLPWDLMSRT